MGLFGFASVMKLRCEGQGKPLTVKTAQQQPPLTRIWDFTSEFPSATSKFPNSSWGERKVQPPPPLPHSAHPAGPVLLRPASFPTRVYLQPSRLPPLPRTEPKASVHLQSPLLAPASVTGSLSNTHVDKWQKITLYISGFTMTERAWEELGLSRGTSISGPFASLESGDDGVNEEMIFHSL